MGDAERFLAEDVGPGDVTTRAVARGEALTARVRAEEACVVAGLAEAREVFERLGAKAEPRVRDGERVAAGAVVLEVEGPAEAVLAGERAALNLLLHLSGVATLTRRVVEAVRAANPRCEVAATRKTTPGLRILEKRAVELGGGAAHRVGLWDGVLVKDNHVALAGGVRAAIERVRAALPGAAVEVEVEGPEQAREALAAGVAWLLLDNWSPEEVAAHAPELRRRDPRVRLEASGGIAPEDAPRYAPWVDRVSLGALTHSARAVPFTLEVVGVQRPATPGGAGS